MTETPKYFELKFYNMIIGGISIEEFENWMYNDKEIESILSSENYLELISFNYKKNEAKDELVNLLFKKYIDIREYEKWKILNKLKIALKRDENLPIILREFYDLYYKGYDFLNNLGFGYGLTVEIPPSGRYKAESWEEMNEEEKQELIDSFYPQLELDIKQAIDWIEKGKIILTGETDEMGYYKYEDLRIEDERKSTVWTEVERNDETGLRVFKSNLKILESPITIHKKNKRQPWWRCL